MPEGTHLHILDTLAQVPDPRLTRARRHNLVDILFLSLCATLCGADSFRSFADYAQSKEAWLRKFLELPGGIPSHQTIARVFARLNSQAFGECFQSWITILRQSLKEALEQEALEQELEPSSEAPRPFSEAPRPFVDIPSSEPADSQTSVNVALPKHIGLDGKTLRHSFDTATGSRSIHMVSAWSWHEGLVLGQVKTDDKSNEITALPELIQILDVEGCLVTIDAAGAQKNIARLIKEKKGDYLLALKRNQPELFADVQAYLDNWIARGFRDEDDRIIEHSMHRTFDAEHGRIETRRYWTMPAPDWLHDKNRWAGLATIAVVESERTASGKTAITRRYYICSLSATAKRLAHAIRNHWGIENKLHWVLDMTFREDACRTRKDNAPQNLAILRHFAINLLRTEKREQRSLQRKRLLAGWRNEYLEQVLTDQHLYQEQPTNGNNKKKL